MTLQFKAGDLHRPNVYVVDKNGAALTGGTTFLVDVRRDSDGAFWDFGGTPQFRTSGWTTRQATLAEVSSSNAPGWYHYAAGVDTTGFSTSNLYLVTYTDSGTTAGNLPASDDFQVQAIFATIATNLTAPSASLTGTASAGASSTITLTGGVATDNYYRFCDVEVTGGTGAGQTRSIFYYVGSTLVATVSRPWATNPDNTSVFAVRPRTQPIVLDTGLAQAGASTTITLASGSSATTDFYNGCTIEIVAGTGIGGQPRVITAYNGSTKVATIASAWATNPDSTSVYALLPVGRTITVSSLDKTGYSIANGSIALATFAAGAIDSTILAANAIGASQIASNAITSAKIATDAIGSAQVAASAVTKIQVGLALTTDVTTSTTNVNAHTDSAVAPLATSANVTSGTSAVEAYGDIHWATATSTAVSSGGITTASFAAGAINAAAIGANAITAAKVATDAIGAAQLASDAVTEIQTGLATATSLATAQTAITDLQTRLPSALVSGRIDASVGAMASGVVTATAIAANAITAAKIATDAIGAAQVAADAVAEIQSGLATSSALATVQADTDDIQTRLPAALVGGRMDASVGAMATDTLSSAAVSSGAVTKIQAGLAGSTVLAQVFAVLAAAQPVVAAGSSSTVVKTGATQASGFFDGKTFVIINAAGVGAARIVSYANTNGAFTVAPALPFTPAASDQAYVLAALAPAVPGDAMALTAGERTTVQALVLSDATPFQGARIDAAVSSRLASASYTAPPTAAAVSTQIWTEPLPGAFGAGSAGALLGAVGTPPSAAAVASAVWSTALPGAFGAGTAGLFLDAQVSTRLATSGYTAPPTTSQNATAVWGTPIPGAFASGTAGFVLGTNLDVVLSTRLPTSGYTTPPTVGAISTQVAADVATAHGAGSWATATGFATSGALSTAQTAITAIQGAGFTPGTDDLRAIRARGDAAWITATGFATTANVTSSTAAIEAYGDVHWATAAGFAVPGSAMTLSAGALTSTAIGSGYVAALQSGLATAAGLTSAVGPLALEASLTAIKGSGWGAGDNLHALTLAIAALPDATTLWSTAFAIPTPSGAVTTYGQALALLPEWILGRQTVVTGSPGTLRFYSRANVQLYSYSLTDSTGSGILPAVGSPFNRGVAT